MRGAARIVGVVWMVACFVLWLWVGFADFGWKPLGDLPPVLSGWSLFAFIRDTKFGLTFAPILLGFVGYTLYDWGGSGNAPAR